MENEWKIAVDGTAISNMPTDKRYATIINPAPSYTQDAQADGNAEKHKIKLIVNVELSDGRHAQYYMNRTSARKVASTLKTDLSATGMMNWVGCKIVWGKILDQMIGGQERKVLYITEVFKNQINSEKTEPVTNPETAQ